MSDKARTHTKLSGTLPQQSTSSVLQRAAVNTSPIQDVPDAVNNVLRSPGQSLDDSTRRIIEPQFGHDFSQVRVHTDSQAVESAQAVGALAYTLGQHVVFGAGQYQPETLSGRYTLLHELTHVVQQRGAVGASSAFDQSDQFEISDPGDAAEYEADQVSRELLASGDSHHRHISSAPIHPLKTLRLQRITHPLEDWGEHRGSKIEIKNLKLEWFVRGQPSFIPSGTQLFEGKPPHERISVPLNDKGHLTFSAHVHVVSAGLVFNGEKDATITGFWEIKNSEGRVSIEGSTQKQPDEHDSPGYEKDWRLSVNDEPSEEGHKLTINIILKDIADKTIKKEASELKLGGEAKAGVEPKVEGEVKGVKAGVSVGSAGVKGSAELKIPLGKTTETHIPGQQEVIPLVIDIHPGMPKHKPEPAEYETLPLLFFRTGSHNLEVSAREGKVPGMGEAEFVKYLNDLRKGSEEQTGKNLEFILEAEATPLGKKGQNPQQAHKFNIELSRERGETIKAVIRRILGNDVIVKDIILGPDIAIAEGAGTLSDEQTHRIVKITLHRKKTSK